MPAPIVALLTDFGENDWFVGTMKGVIKNISPQSDVIDITHQIPPQDIKSGAMALESAYSYFSAGTVFCCVIDPGVGTQRSAIAATDGTYFFVSPNNGLLTLVEANRPHSFSQVELTNRAYFLDEISSTFHGRDVFSPVAAHLAAGVPLSELGRPLENIVRLQFSLARVISENTIAGNVNYVDHFGNLMTNIKRSHIESLQPGPTQGWRLQINNKVLIGLTRTFADRQAGEPLFYFNSADYLEIAVNQGRAEQALAASIDMPVQLLIRPAD